MTTPSESLPTYSSALPFDSGAAVLCSGPINAADGMHEQWVSQDGK